MRNDHSLRPHQSAERAATSETAQPITRARTDAEIVESFLRELRGRSPHTARAYGTVLNRFLLWLEHTGHGDFQGLRREEALGYRDFIAAPSPPEDWTSPQRHRRNDPRWRPFTGPLSREGIRRELGMLRRFFAYLRRSGYLRVNPFDLETFALDYLPSAETSRAHKGDFEIQGERFLEREALAYVWRALQLRPLRTERAVAAYERDRWLLTLAYIAALRTEEMATHTMGSFRSADGGETWRLQILGKGAKAAAIDCSPRLVEALIRFRVSLQRHPQPHPKETLALVPSIGEQRRALSTRQIYRALTELFRDGAQLARHEHAPSYITTSLERASPHWLRHSRASHLLDGVLPRVVIRRLLRHSHDTSLDIYSHATGQSKDDALRRGDEVFDGISALCQR